MPTGKLQGTSVRSTVTVVVVVVCGIGAQCEYQSLWNSHTKPVLQHKGPCQSAPPHCCQAPEQLVDKNRSRGEAASSASALDDVPVLRNVLNVSSKAPQNAKATPKALGQNCVIILDKSAFYQSLVQD
mmetsp:Transcript_66400/g.126510  ORF Transcript_66400/g.126510 Transcript_66400/m.126510 type:complete len:128 (-) Transcript_66400:16-399(-)